MELFHPLSQPNISQQFKGPKVHPGLDYSAPIGTPVYASGDGIVSASYVSQGHTTKAEGPPWSYGERIVITHPDGSQTTYNHLSTRIVEKGDIVVAGQKIGEVGNTGYSFGPHLHFEYRDNEQSAYSDPGERLTLGLPPSLSSATETNSEGTSNQGKIILGVIVFAGLALGAIFIAKGA